MFPAQKHFRGFFMSDSIGLYIHIPFCKSKCPYCDFYSNTTCADEYDRYIKILDEKIKYWSIKANRTVSSIYFGGGTPSVLGAERLSFLLSEIKNSFTVKNNAEITVEVNPDTGKVLEFELLKNVGFNRISVGMQSAVENELKALGRIHTANDAEAAVIRAKKAGFKNISLDLMIGIPYQTVESLKASIDFCSKCGVTHISSYILKIENGTVFDKIKNTLSFPDDDYQAELYLSAVEHLEKLGFKQYEISNFAKEGFESRHNINYWNCGEYIGIGPSAHSFLKGKRFYYNRNMTDFKNDIIYYDSDGGSKEEFIMLSLRLKSGLDFDEYKTRYGEDLPKVAVKKIKKYADMGFMDFNGNRANFTPNGFLVSNSIISELI